MSGTYDATNDCWLKEKHFTGSPLRPIEITNMHTGIAVRHGAKTDTVGLASLETKRAAMEPRDSGR